MVSSIDLVRKDLTAIKLKLERNPMMQVRNLIKSLTNRSDTPLSSYEMDLSLLYLKQLYEHVFPDTAHGGNRRSSQMRPFHIIRNPHQASSDKSSHLMQKPKHDLDITTRNIMTHLLETIQTQNQYPNFMQVMKSRTSLSRSTIQNHVKIARFLTTRSIDPQLLALYRSSTISYFQMLKTIITLKREEKRNG